MQQYMFKSPKGTGYLFRRGVPADVHDAIGKREFKHTLGGDFRSACQQCRELAVETDRLIQSARASGARASAANIPAPPATPPQEEPLKAIHDVTPGLAAQLRATVIDQVLKADQQQRHRSMVAVNVQEKLSQFERVRNLGRLAQLGDYTAALGWRDMLVGTLKRNGYCLAPELQGSEGERTMLVEYASAYGEALDILEAQYTGKPLAPSRPASPPLSSPPMTGDVGTKLLSEAVKEFLAQLPPGKRSMNEKHGFILPAFLELVGDMPIGDLKQSHIKDFLLTVQKLPPR